ncbi:hypothetical protein GUJ93_ZPchr0002g25253 [Zizania palustris]|uniref:Uncharacterized protein n=1 Tax=Zizania palustris TaxID=103762 RepID=A0A8J5S867_ZIZPA|nr:hypothetical protein GUJ93_ZPchr0002g25253 [Zizania palustris]
MWSPWSRASYSATLLDAVKHKRRTYFKSSPWGDVKSNPFYNPFGDPHDGVPVSQDIAEWELGDHLHEVGLEVMLELSDGDEDSVQQLLHLGVSNLRWPQDFRYEVEWSLNQIGEPLLRLFDDQGGADHMHGGGDVEEEGST